MDNAGDSIINFSMSVITDVLPIPIPEQEAARELFQKREGLRIDAYAGTGKTTTLKLLADSSSQRGFYLAFNRSIADEASQRFCRQVVCATSHSIAFRSIRRAFGYPEWKMTGLLTPNMIVVCPIFCTSFIVSVARRVWL